MHDKDVRVVILAVPHIMKEYPGRGPANNQQLRTEAFFIQPSPPVVVLNVYVRVCKAYASVKASLRSLHF